MAYEVIGNSSDQARKKSTEMEVGEVIEGYVLDLPETNGDFGEQTNILLQLLDSGETVLLYTAGTLKYDARDGRIKKGLKTMITRLDDEKRKSKNGKAYTTSVFEVKQDKTCSIYAEAQEEASAASSSIKDRVKKLQQKQQA